MNARTDTSRIVAIDSRQGAEQGNVISRSSGRRHYRTRDFGVGYGNSSGYALDKRYTSDWGQLRFRCA